MPVVADKDCLDIHNRKPSAPSGAYNVTIKNATLTVWCDMDKDGGGWTVKQLADLTGYSHAHY